MSTTGLEIVPFSFPDYARAMSDPELREATDEDVLFSLSFALSRDGRKRFSHARRG